MGKTIFAAVIAAILASIATVLVMSSFQSEKSVELATQREQKEATERVERERLVRRITELETRISTVQRVERRAPSDGVPAAEGTSDAALPQIAPDGTPYVSQAQLEAFAKSQVLSPARESMDLAAIQPVEKKSLEDIARDQNLSAGEEANLRNILRESEEEMIHSLFGDKPIDDVKREVLEAKEDPDKQAALMQGLIQNGFANVGKIMTLENRTKKRVESVLGAERAKTFLAAPRKPVIAPEFEDVLKGF